MLARPTQRPALLILLGSCLAAGLGPLEAGGQSLAERGLSGVFSADAVVQDRNGDHVVDFVDAAVVLGQNASPAEVASAAEVAARLGFETMAMDLPLPRSPAGTAIGILIGAAARERTDVRERTGVAALAPGAGIVTVVHSGGRDWIVIAGADDTGTRAAARAFAGRLPKLWDPEGDGFDELTAAVTAVLSEQEITGDGPRVTGVEVHDGADALWRVEIEVEVASDAEVDAARAAFEALLAERGEPPVLSFEGALTVSVTARAPSGAAATADVPRVETGAESGPIPARPGSGGKNELDLSNLYTNDGFLGDSDSDEIPDRIDAALSPEGPGAEGVIDLAARLGLEAVGITVPIVRLPEEIRRASGEPTLVLVGPDHTLVRQLADSGRVDLAGLEPGQGRIEVVRKAFGEKTALVVAGGDSAGTARAVAQVAERFPHVWEPGKDRTTLDDVEMELWRFLSGRSPAGQATMALYKLDRIAAMLDGKTLESAHVLLSLERPAEGFREVVRERAAALGASSLQVTVDDRDVQNAAVIIDESFEVASEVDEFWQALRSELLPKIERGQQVHLEARLSEPLEIRREIERAALGELVEQGAAESSTVTVLSAYKQGYSWLYDSVRPRLIAKRPSSLVIYFARNDPPSEWPQQAMHTPLRWLHEVFPIDEILARELGLDLEHVRFEMADAGAPIYRMVATDHDGRVLIDETFEPRYVLRPYFDRFDDYELVRVTTGWIEARAGGEVLIDRRIVTDAERFWDHFQSRTLPALYDYVMTRHEGNPRGEGRDAPYLGELRVELELSEPHDLLDLDKEIIAPMDALHEEIYFGTLEFFELLGRNARGQGLSYPGRVIPVMLPKADGKPGRARIRATGFATSRPAVVVDYVEAGGAKGQVRLDIPRITMERPSAMAATVRHGLPGLERLDVRVEVDTEEDERDALVRRAPKEEVDETMLSAEQVTAVVSHLAELRARGAYVDALAFHDLDEIRVRAGWTHEPDPDAEVVATLPPNGEPEPPPDFRALLSGTWEPGGGPIVQWDTPIPPPEAYELLAKMGSAFPEATVYKVGESYLGKDIWAMDLMPPIEASHWSHAKATTWKPTVVYSARQHANEVSSTSHVLRFAELLLTDSTERAKLDRVNVVIHPITNPDGAQLAYDLYRLTPDLILHAGYLGSLGVDATSGANDDMPIYPEAKVRGRLWRTWLPDIFLNPHGYPSHQVVQLFSEYTGLVRRGRVTERNWSMNKGWFMPGFGYLDDPRHPRHKDAAFRIRDYITRAINASPDVYAMNQRNYDRYRRYGVDHDPDVFRLDMTDDVLIEMPLKGSRASGNGDRSRGFNPKVTIWSGTTEAPDETAYGDWMKLVATAGLSWDRAILDYLVDGDHRVKRSGSTFWGGVALKLNRPRPPEDEH